MDGHTIKDMTLFGLNEMTLKTVMIIIKNVHVDVSKCNVQSGTQHQNSTTVSRKKYITKQLNTR